MFRLAHRASLLHFLIIAHSFFVQYHIANIPPGSTFVNINYCIILFSARYVCCTLCTLFVENKLYIQGDLVLVPSFCSSFAMVCMYLPRPGTKGTTPRNISTPRLYFICTKPANTRFDIIKGMSSQVLLHRDILVIGHAKTVCVRDSII